ncbi:OmpA family protein [Ottowia thiooxydans]|uniref:OmpA family protein n=1 Tax=Ottowia thiooxydans TaxID=219182 RepID=UPI000559F2F0|nr:OmpA family protein [Ottowia thiooxydans]
MHRRVRHLRSACLAGLMVGTVLAGSAAGATDITRSNRALSGEPSRLAPAANAPQTSLRRQQTPDDLSPGYPSTSLKSTAVPDTLLRTAEVPPERLERTRALLKELKAQPTPSKAISIDLPADVLFDFDKFELRADAGSSLDQAAELIQGYPAAPLLVRGHTDAKGSDAYNDRLSQRRALTVALALQERTGRKAATQGLGRREPVAANQTKDGKDNPEGRQLNRRVQILIEAGQKN